MHVTVMDYFDYTLHLVLGFNLLLWGQSRTFKRDKRNDSL